MRKFLAIFGTLTVTTSSVGFLSNAFLASKTTINIKDETKDLTAAKIIEVDKESQSWNDAKIDETLKHSLQYHHQQLSINKKQLDMTKLPTEVLNHLDLALVHLNEAVNNGYIKVVVNNSEVQLIYPTNPKTFKNLDNSNNDIIYFDSNSIGVKSKSSYMWYSTYGPSHWWKFWEWGGYIHFGETAVHVANIIHILASIANLLFLFKNITEIEKIIGELKIAHTIGDTVKVNNELKQLSKIFGGFDLNLLGEIVNIIAIFTTVIIFIMTLLSLPTIGEIIWGVLELTAGLFATVTGQMVNTDKGKGVKWKWPCFIIPGKISAE
ncbi:hypothetical protein LT336_00821 [Spiroplasma sp. JKS002671]|uniref:hypothetical protein n=1 Tax=Spiroplasma attinicola TaxID=2904537 RepID=UPI0020229F1F|nr:hypothetical protein [Spiroplasma sp. JKS002671]MCL8211068.1 hypothetical protein [Spiroplasma sp. JKS002671]